jgi:CBS domain-containing protein
LHRETFRRTLKDKGPFSLKAPPSKKRGGEIMHVARSPVSTMASTTPIYDAIKIMAEEGFRRMPIANPGTKTLEGIITATDIIDYVGGGEKFKIIQQKYDGNFFKAINQPIKSVMTREVVSIKIDAKISEAIGLMKEKKVGGLPVVDHLRRIRGIITERDIVNFFGDHVRGTSVAQLMSKKVVTALPKTTIFEAEKTMIAEGFRRLPIVADGSLTGIVTTMDIIRFFGSGQVFKHLQSGTVIQVLNTPVLELATKEIVTVEPAADVGQAAKIMRDKSIGALPVVEDRKFVGIITERDFFKTIA